MMHRTVIDYVPDIEQMQRKMIEGIVSLYRRSQMAEEEGCLFLTKAYVSSQNQLEIGLIRTSDPAQISGLRGMTYFAGVRELSDDEIINLFMAT